jgi:hypothetical protein
MTSSIQSLLPGLSFFPKDPYVITTGGVGAFLTAQALTAYFLIDPRRSSLPPSARLAAALPFVYGNTVMGRDTSDLLLQCVAAFTLTWMASMKVRGGRGWGCL